MQEDQGSGRSGQNLFRFGALQEEEASPQRNQSGDAVAVGMFTYRQATQGQEASTNFAALHTEANTTERIIEKLGVWHVCIFVCTARQNNAIRYNHIGVNARLPPWETS